MAGLAAPGESCRGGRLGVVPQNDVSPVNADFAAGVTCDTYEDTAPGVVVFWAAAAELS